MRLNTLFSWVTVFTISGASFSVYADTAADEINKKINGYTAIADAAWTSSQASIEFTNLEADLRAALKAATPEMKWTDAQVAAQVARLQQGGLKKDLRAQKLAALAPHYLVKSVTTVDKLVKGREIKEYFDAIRFPVENVPVYQVNFFVASVEPVIFLPAFVPAETVELQFTFPKGLAVTVHYRCTNDKKLIETIHDSFFGDRDVLIVDDEFIVETESNRAIHAAGSVVRALRRMHDYNSKATNQIFSAAYLKQEGPTLLTKGLAQAKADLVSVHESVEYKKAIKALEEKLAPDLKDEALQRSLKSTQEGFDTDFTNLVASRFVHEESISNKNSNFEMIQFWKKSGITIGQVEKIFTMVVPVMVDAPGTVMKLKDGSEFTVGTDGPKVPYLQNYARTLYNARRAGN